MLNTLYWVGDPNISLETPISCSKPPYRVECSLLRWRPPYLVVNLLIVLNTLYCVGDPNISLETPYILLKTLISRWRLSYLVGDSNISLKTPISRLRLPYLVCRPPYLVEDPHNLVGDPISRWRLPFIFILKDQLSFSHKLRFSYPLSLQLMLATIDISNHEFCWIKYY